MRTCTSACQEESVEPLRCRCKQIERDCRLFGLNHQGDTAINRSRAQGLMSTQRDYAPDYQSIPAHGRWQHFEAGGRPRVDQLLASWPSSVDAQERTRRLIDLFLVSVLLDAGAGTRWTYKSKESGKIYGRSEGLAVASLEMFKAGYFSGEPLEPCQVDSAGLKRLDVKQLAKGLQVTESNAIDGLEGRAGLLSRLADALKNTALFGKEGRPGNMLGKFLHIPIRLHILTKRTRLSPLTSNHPSCLSPSHYCPHPLDRPLQWTEQSLAPQSYRHRRRIPR